MSCDLDYLLYTIIAPVMYQDGTIVHKCNVDKALLWNVPCFLKGSDGLKSEPMGYPLVGAWTDESHGV